eukprot:CAMPEP_0198277264 /NCGR_PEP_ID=MMETSP1447-20131203/65754_1 /TAXON_ID=420782 /ORGANISM="Chaetoceros dichaeta, Strain CCMP1751" /LENGTH=120 /DNA_ID=CAMNT_0043972269 /DNA_START=544 /DNA_END=906 /DNA_ORIENTATION=+
MDPTRKLDFSMATGIIPRVGRTSAGEFIVHDNPTTILLIETAASAGEFIVHDNPTTIIIIETAAVMRGAAMARSKRLERDCGKDLRGVILPKVPIWSEGSGTGKPILIPVRRAVMTCITS